MRQKNDSYSVTLNAVCKYDRVWELVKERKPLTEKDHLRILEDRRVMMNITMQQMVLNAGKGSIFLN